MIEDAQSAEVSHPRPELPTSAKHGSSVDTVSGQSTDAAIKGAGVSRYGLTTSGVVLHCPAALQSASARVRHQWKQAIEHLLSDRTLASTVADEPALTVLTYNTEATPSLFERCMHHLGLHVEALKNPSRQWSWAEKVKLVHERLMSRPASDYLLCVDGFDTLLVGDPREVLRRFKHTEVQMLFASTGTDWPPSPQHRAFEIAVAGEADAAHRHLNASFIGRTTVITEYLAQIVDAIDARASWCYRDTGFDDQLAWREMHRRHYPLLQIDNACRIFTRFDSHR